MRFHSGVSFRRACGEHSRLALQQQIKQYAFPPGAPFSPVFDEIAARLDVTAPLIAPNNGMR